MLRIAHGAEQIDVRVDTRGIAEVAVADTPIPTLPNGEWLLHFSRWQERPQFSAAQVLRGDPNAGPPVERVGCDDPARQFPILRGGELVPELRA